MAEEWIEAGVSSHIMTARSRSLFVGPSARGGDTQSYSTDPSTPCKKGSASCIVNVSSSPSWMTSPSLIRRWTSS